MRRSLTKFNFLTKIIKVSNICYFWRIFRNIYQNANWPVNIFVIIFWSKVKLLTWLYLGVSYLLWAQVQKQLSRLTTSHLQLQSSWNRAPMLPILQMFYSSASNKSLLPLNSLQRIDGPILSQNYSEQSKFYYELAANKYLLGRATFSASLISSVSSLDQCKSILEIRKWNYGLLL